MEVRLHAALFQKEAFGPSFMHELKNQFQFVTGDFQRLIQRPEGLACLHIDDLPADFVLNSESLELMVFLGHEIEDPRSVEMLELGCADFIIPPLGAALRAGFVGAKLLSIRQRVQEGLILRKIVALEDQYDLHLTEKERRLLRGLFGGESSGMTRSELVEACWPKMAVNHKTLDTHLFNLRRKLESVDYQVLFQGGRWYLVSPTAQSENKIS